MDRHRRDSNDDGGASRERRRSRSPDRQRRTNHRSRRDSPKRSRSTDQNRSSKTNNDATIAIDSHNDTRNKDSSREEPASYRDRKVAHNLIDTGGADSGRGRPRNDAGGREEQGSGRSDSSSSRKDEGDRKEDIGRKSGDEVKSRHHYTDRLQKKRSRSPPNRENNLRELDSRGDRADSSRKRDSDTNAKKTSTSGAIDDQKKANVSGSAHDDRREKRSRRGDDSRVEDSHIKNEAATKGEAKRSSKNDTSGGESCSTLTSERGHRERADAGEVRIVEACTGEARGQSVEDRYGPSEIAEREAARDKRDEKEGKDERNGGRGRVVRDGKSDRDISQIYRPRDTELRQDEFLPPQQWGEGPYSATGRGSMENRRFGTENSGNRRDFRNGFPGQDHMANHAFEMNMCGMGGGMGMGIGGSFGQRISGWDGREDGGNRQRGGSVTDGVNDWQQHLSSFSYQGPVGPQGPGTGTGPGTGSHVGLSRRLSGFPGDGDFNPHLLPVGFNNQAWDWNRGPQNRNVRAYNFSIRIVYVHVLCG